MKYLVFTSALKDDTIVSVIDFIQNNEDQPLTIFINSDGGNNGAASILLRVLNENASRITLIAFDWVYSSAFRIFASFTGEKGIVVGCRAMYHLASLDIGFLASGKLSSQHDSLCAQHSHIARGAHDKDFFRAFASDAEFEQYEKGLDVYFTYARLTQIFPTALIIE